MTTIKQEESWITSMLEHSQIDERDIRAIAIELQQISKEREKKDQEIAELNRKLTVFQIELAKVVIALEDEAQIAKHSGTSIGEGAEKAYLTAVMAIRHKFKPLSTEETARRG
jgi:hypothetical protein